MRPYRLINTHELNTLSCHFAQVLKQWNEDYALNALSFALTKPKNWNSLEGAAQLSDEEGTVIAFIYFHYAPLMQEALFGEEEAAFDEPCKALFLQLGQQLFKQRHCSISNETTQNPQAWCYPGSTALLLELVSPNHRLSLLLNPEWVYKELPQTVSEMPLTSVDEALNEQKLSFSVTLDRIMLPVNRLAELQVGDVLISDHPLNQALLFNLGTKALATAELGTASQHKSIQLKEFL